MNRLSTLQKVLMGVVVVIVLVLVQVWLLNPARYLGAPDLTGPRLAASYDWALEDLEGKPVSLESYKGKTIFLNEWATWCPPCRAEMPSIESLAKNPRLSGVVFLAISQEDRDTLRRFVAQGDFHVPVLRAPEPPPPVYQTEGIPATFIISPDGHVVTRHIGSAKWDDPSVVSLIEGLMK